MKLVKVTKNYTEFHDDIWGSIKLKNWDSFLRESEISDKIDEQIEEVDEEELKKGYDDLCKEYIGAP